MTGRYLRWLTAIILAFTVGLSAPAAYAENGYDSYQSDQQKKYDQYRGNGDHRHEEKTYDRQKKYSYECCKICRKGKACGDTCISRNYTCRKGRGCACNAWEVQ